MMQAARHGPLPSAVADRSVCLWPLAGTLFWVRSGKPGPNQRGVWAAAIVSAEAPRRFLAVRAAVHRPIGRARRVGENNKPRGEGIWCTLAPFRDAQTRTLNHACRRAGRCESGCPV